MSRVAVVYHFEPSHISACSGVQGALDLVRETTKAFGCTGLGIIDAWGLNPPIGDAEMDNHVFNSLCEAEMFYEEYVRIWVEAEKSIPAECARVWDDDFQHPRGDTAYFFGADSAFLPLDCSKIIVTLPTLCAPWSVGVMAVILRERMRQHGSHA